MSDPRTLLALQAATLFELSRQGRILRSNSADTAAPPRMYLAGCETGWIARLRHDVNEATAETIAGLLALEPPVIRRGATPQFAERYRDLLGGEPLTGKNYGPIHRLPHHTEWRDDIATIRSGTPEGVALTARLLRDGMPAGLIEAGFTDLSHFWEPWCVGLDGEEIATVAFAARLGVLAAEIGVHTMRAFRGHGFAAAATAAWSAHPDLRHRTLFYSTDRDNLASQRVIERLGLPFLGESMRL